MSIPPVRSQGDSGHIQDHNDIGTELAARLPLSGGTLTGALNGTSATFSGTVSADNPTSSDHLATKSYVDSQSASIPGITAGYVTRITIVYQSTINPFPDSQCTQIFAVTFPAGRFTSPPAVSGGANRFRCHINGIASTTSSATLSYQNFDIVSLGPPSGSPSDIVEVMAIQGD